MIFNVNFVSESASHPVLKDRNGNFKFFPIRWATSEENWRENARQNITNLEQIDQDWIERNEQSDL